MDAHEIRIGNIVGLKDGSWTVISAETFKTTKFWESVDGLYQGVAITEYWASSLGLQIKSDAFITYIEDENGFNNEFNLSSFADGNGNKIWTVQFKGQTLRTIQYVHQFQNLFFMLSDYELTLAL